MNLKKILQDPEIGKRIYEEIPVTKNERAKWCVKADRDARRLELAKKLFEERQNEKVEYDTKG